MELVPILHTRNFIPPKNNTIPRAYNPNYEMGDNIPPRFPYPHGDTIPASTPKNAIGWTTPGMGVLTNGPQEKCYPVGTIPVENIPSLHREFGHLREAVNGYQDQTLMAYKLLKGDYDDLNKRLLALEELYFDYATKG